MPHCGNVLVANSYVRAVLISSVMNAVTSLTNILFFTFMACDKIDYIMSVTVGVVY